MVHGLPGGVSNGSTRCGGWYWECIPAYMARTKFEHGFLQTRCRVCVGMRGHACDMGPGATSSVSVTIKPNEGLCAQGGGTLSAWKPSNKHGRGECLRVGCGGGVCRWPTLAADPSSSSPHRPDRSRALARAVLHTDPTGQGLCRCPCLRRKRTSATVAILVWQNPTDPVPSSSRCPSCGPGFWENDVCVTRTEPRRRGNRKEPHGISIATWPCEFSVRLRSLVVHHWIGITIAPSSFLQCPTIESHCGGAVAVRVVPRRDDVPCVLRQPPRPVRVHPLRPHHVCTCAASCGVSPDVTCPRATGRPSRSFGTRHPVDHSRRRRIRSRLPPRGSPAREPGATTTVPILVNVRPPAQDTSPPRCSTYHWDAAETAMRALSSKELYNGGDGVAVTAFEQVDAEPPSHRSTLGCSR